MAELVVAFDLPTGKEALALASRLPGLGWAKIGSVLYVREGPALVREFTARGVRVFLDLKWHDIPNTVAGAVEGARELGVSLATVHCLGGAAMLEAARKAGGEGEGEGGGELALVGVTVLTSHTSAGFEAVVGRGVPDLGLEVVRLAHAARAAGLRGVVASGHEVGLLREALGVGPWLVVPGIRAPDGVPDDQARTVTPAEAVRRGATHVVVGRPITGARDPQAAYRGMLEAMTP